MYLRLTTSSVAELYSYISAIIDVKRACPLTKSEMKSDYICKEVLQIQKITLKT